MESAGGAQHLPRHGRIMGEQRHHQRPAAPVGDGCRLVQIIIGHNGGDRAEGLFRVHDFSRHRRIAAQQHRAHERALPGIRADCLNLVRVAKDNPGFLAEPGDAGAHISALCQGGQRPHPHLLQARIADGDVAEPAGDRRLHRVGLCPRNQNAPNGGTFLPRLDGHFARYLFGEQVKFRRACHRVGAEDGGVQAVALGDKPHPLPGHHRVVLQLDGGAGGTGKGHRILAVQLIENVPGAAHHQLQRPGGQQAGFDHNAHGGLTQRRRRAGRFDNGRHARQQGRTQFLQHPPDREVEGIDMQRQPVARGKHMLADEAALLRQRRRAAIHQHGVIGQLPAADGGVGEQGPRAALDIDPAIASARAGVIRQLIERLLARDNRLGQPLEQHGALMEGKRAQGRAAGLAGVAGHGPEIQPVRSGSGHHLAGHGRVHLA